MVQAGHAPDPGAKPLGEMRMPPAVQSWPLTPAQKGVEVKSSGQGLPQWQCSFEDLYPLQGRISLRLGLD
jgi:hypothetical protein